LGSGRVEGSAGNGPPVRMNVMVPAAASVTSDPLTGPDARPTSETSAGPKPPSSVPYKLRLATSIGRLNSTPKPLLVGLMDFTHSGASLTVAVTAPVPTP